MNKQEVQKILRALDECCELKTALFKAISANVDDWQENIDECCEAYCASLDEIIDLLEDWAADCSATYSNYLCQEQDSEMIEYDISFSDYLCMQESTGETTTTTSGMLTTTTTTVDANCVQFEISFDEYLCMQEDDPSATTTTTLPFYDGTVLFIANYIDRLCEEVDNPLVPTTTTTTSEGYTTTTSTTVNPEDVEFSATYLEFLCEKKDNPILTTTTTSTTINEDDIVWEIAFDNYMCQQIDDSIAFAAVYEDYVCEEVDNPLVPTTTTTTSEGYTTTTSTTVDPEEETFVAEYEDYLCEEYDDPLVTTSTTTVMTTTTTVVDWDCPVSESGITGFPIVKTISLGSTIGKVTFSIDTISAPDKFVVEWGGSEVINTGYRGDTRYQDVLYKALIAQGAPTELVSGTSKGTFTFEKTTADDLVTIKIYAPISETEWSFEMSCPVPSALVTTTSTTEGMKYSAAYYSYLCGEVDDPLITTTTIAPTTTTTTLATTTTTTVGVYGITCGESASGKTVFPLEVYIVDMGAGVGYVTLDYDTKAEPDKFVVEIDGLEVLNTGYVGDPSLQSVLDEELASRGLPSETIQGVGTGVAKFYKESATTIAVIKVYAPIKETLWSFTVYCPDGSTTTTSTSTTTIATTTTTTIPPTTTTTTTNAVPVSSDNEVENRGIENCGQVKILVPANFPFTDKEGDGLDKVKITSYSLAGLGSLKYNGVTVTENQILTVFGGASGSFLHTLEYTPDIQEDAFEDTIEFLVKTKNNENYG